jgi:hypothetical protein
MVQVLPEAIDGTLQAALNLPGMQVINPIKVALKNGRIVRNRTKRIGSTVTLHPPIRQVIWTFKFVLKSGIAPLANYLLASLLIVRNALTTDGCTVNMFLIMAWTNPIV